MADIFGTSLQFVDAVDDDGTLALDGASEMAIWQSGGQTFVFVASSFENAVQIFSMAPDGSLTSLGAVTDTSATALAGANDLVVFTAGGTPFLAVTGGTDSGVSTFELSTAAPYLTHVDTLVEADNPAGLRLDGAWGIDAVETASGTYLYVGGTNSIGITIFSVDAMGVLQIVGSVADSATTEIDGTAEIHHFTHDGADYLIVGGLADAGFTVFSIDAQTGLLTEAGTFDGGTPYDFETTEIGGTTYIYAAEGRFGTAVYEFTGPGAPIRYVQQIEHTTANNEQEVNALELIERDGEVLLVAFNAQDDEGYVFEVAPRFAPNEGQLSPVGDTFNLFSISYGLAHATIDGRTFVLHTEFGGDELVVYELGGGDDFLVGGFNSDQIFGLGGDDTLVASSGADTLIGGPGADVLFGGGGFAFASYEDATSAVTVNAEDGTASGAEAEGDQLFGISGLIGSAFSDTLTGTRVNGGGMGDTITAATDTASVLNGEAGNDLLNGSTQNDFLSGGFSQDTLLGGGGDDSLNGGAGNDHMDGGAGDDTYFAFGGNGSLTINLSITGAQDTGDGIDTLSNIESVRVELRPGNHRLIGTTGDNRLEAYSGGADSLFGLGGDDTLAGGGGNDVLNGGSGDDSLFGSGGRDTLLGGAGDDLLDAGPNNFNDSLRGGDGADTLDGGQGRDILMGGEVGAPDGDPDVFVWSNRFESLAGAATRDVVRDFEVGIDTLDLSSIDATPGMNGNQAFAFIGTAAFSGTAGELRYFNVGGNTILRADTDGDGLADFEVLLNGTLTLTAADFVL